MKFEDIKPFVRNVKFMKGTEGVFKQPEAAYDMTLYYIYDGSCEFKTEDSSYTMKRGCLFLIRGGRYMNIENLTAGTRVFRISFDYVFDYNVENGYPMKTAPKEAFNKDFLIETPYFEDSVSINAGEFFAENLIYLENRLTELLIEFSNRRNYFEQKLSYEMASLLIEIVRGKSRNVKIKKEDLDAYSIINYIHENCC